MDHTWCHVHVCGSMLHLRHTTVLTELHSEAEGLIKHAKTAETGNMRSILFGHLRSHILPCDKQVLTRVCQGFVNMGDQYTACSERFGKPLSGPVCHMVQHECESPRYECTTHRIMMFLFAVAPASSTITDSGHTLPSQMLTWQSLPAMTSLAFLKPDVHANYAAVTCYTHIEP